MAPKLPTSDSGQRLRAERERLRLSTRDVESLSRQIAQDKKNQDYAVSHTWVTEVENGKFVPTLFKLYTLSVIYHRSLDEVLGFFGITYRELVNDQKCVPLPRTALLGTIREGVIPTLDAPLELRDRVGLEQTNLISRMFKSWGEVPVGLLQDLDLRRSLYGYIGTDDYTLYPHIRPGSFVQIDARQRTIVSGWQNEFERPIYFVELRDSYVCSWCELLRGELTLIPSQGSRMQTRRVRYPEDAEVVGRVTAVTMHLVKR
jgi:transcriptional regulator with XRE-family HTH domain